MFSFLLTLLFQVSLVLISLFTLFNLKISDFYQLVPRHTDCLCLSFITSLTAKLSVRLPRRSPHLARLRAERRVL